LPRDLILIYHVIWSSTYESKIPRRNEAEVFGQLAVLLAALLDALGSSSERVVMQVRGHAAGWRV